jgi:hypothetical protein
MSATRVICMVSVPALTPEAPQSVALDQRHRHSAARSQQRDRRSARRLTTRSCMRVIAVLGWGWDVGGVEAAHQSASGTAQRRPSGPVADGMAHLVALRQQLCGNIAACGPGMGPSRSGKCFIWLTSCAPAAAAFDPGASRPRNAHDRVGRNACDRLRPQRHRRPWHLRTA